MKIGNLDIADCKIGSTQVNKVYLGANLVWEKASPLLLDLYPNAAAAYSLRKLRSDYTGDSIRVRRSSDNTETDIGFVDNELDTASLLTFVGAGDGFVTTWYDQSGLGNNVTQTSASQQPKIVISGSVITENGKPTVKFDAISNTKMQSQIFTQSSQPITRMVVGKGDAGGYFVDGSASNRGVIGSAVSSYRIFAGNIFDAGTYSPLQQLIYALFNGVNSEIVINGSSLGIGNSGTQGLDQITIGSHPTVTTVNLNGNIQEIIIYASDQSTNRTAIESNINSHYTIY